MAHPHDDDARKAHKQKLSMLDVEGEYPPDKAARLAGPQKKVAGTKMGFPGFSDPADEADVIAYLGTLK